MAAAEKALRARAEQFYQLEVEKKFRQADAFVAEETKDLYFNSAKPNIQSFSLGKIELSDGNTKARVTVKAKSTVMMIGAGELPLETSAVALWKIEKGKWVWYVDPHAPIETPFGKMSFPGSSNPSIATPNAAAAFGKVPDLDAIKQQVAIDRTSLVLTRDKPSDTVTITNSMPGFVEVSLTPSKIQGVEATLETGHVGAGEKAVVHIRSTGSSRADGNIHLSVEPLGVEYDVHVQAN